jgi:uncharacterized protein YbbC (DUF1343 family)
MITSGLEIFIEQAERYRKRKVALIANQTSVTSTLRYSWEVLKDRGIEIKRIFSPEHGLFSVEQDQVAARAEVSIDCEVVSLYGTSLKSLLPDRAHVSDVDLVLLDIQDVGSRYYTYLNTMALFMKEINGMDIEFVVLDRPNPLNGVAVEGPLLQKEYESFVGVFNVSVRHGMTAGELALLYKHALNLDIHLSVIKMRGWDRTMVYRKTGLPWIPPSPNMPTQTTADLYPGMCLLEGTNLSEGRGTTHPFVTIGAPFIESQRYARALNSLALRGVYFRPVCFRPTFNKYAGQVVHGVYIHITDDDAFEPFRTGVAVIKTAYDMYRNEFVFSKGVYEFNDTLPAFDLLAGGSDIRCMIEAGKGLNEISDSWRDAEKEFIANRREYLLY